MAASCQHFALTLLRRKCCIILAARHYSIRPPPTLGFEARRDELKRDHQVGQFPTLEQRLRELNTEDSEVAQPVDIGVSHKPSSNLKRESRQLWRNRRLMPELEQAARLQKLRIPLDMVKETWLEEMGPQHTKRLGEHYGVYEDLFGGAFFLPVVNLKVFFDYDEEHLLPVYMGNRISPLEASKAPQIVEFEAEEDSLWTLLMTNPDGHLTDNDSEYLHWFVGNIPGGEVSKGETICDYLQPFPPRGTGFHRHIFLLFKQDGRIDYSSLQKPPNCTSLSERTFQTREFMRAHQEDLTPVGLSLFQSEYDDSVRDIYHNVLEMREPSFEYAYPPFYHPPPEAYPHKQPFDRYYDRYRDKKDIAEEVLKMKFAMTSPYEKYQQPKFPMIHRPWKGTKPTWLIKREDKMARRVEQFKDLP